MADLQALINEFRRAFEAGEGPNPQAILERASAEDRQTLAAEIDSYLMTAPRRAWDPAAYAESPARGVVERTWESLELSSEPLPELLPELRNRAAIKRKDLVARLARALGVGGQEAKVRDYYHELEQGLLPPRGVSSRVFEALAEILGTSADRLLAAGAATRPATAGAQAAFMRVASAKPGEIADADDREADTAPPLAATGGGEEPPDEVDELFTGG
jgi:hypothetical protein